MFSLCTLPIRVETGTMTTSASCPMTASADPRYICMDVHATRRLGAPASGARPPYTRRLGAPASGARPLGLPRAAPRARAEERARSRAGSVGSRGQVLAARGPAARRPGQGAGTAAGGAALWEVHANLRAPQGFLVEPRREPACPPDLPAVRAAPAGPVDRAPEDLPWFWKRRPSLRSRLHSKTLFCFLSAARLFLSLGPLQLACSVQKRGQE